MGIDSVVRIEMFINGDKATAEFDPMFHIVYTELNQDIFTVAIEPEPIKHIDDIAAYNISEGLAMNDEEVEYIEYFSKKHVRILILIVDYGIITVYIVNC